MSRSLPKCLEVCQIVVTVQDLFTEMLPIAP